MHSKGRQQFHTLKEAVYTTFLLERPNLFAICNLACEWLATEYTAAFAFYMKHAKDGKRFKLPNI
jgi:hypothetical protein